MEKTLKDKISKPLHILFIVCLVSLTFSICLGLFLFSFETLLLYFQYPLLGEIQASPYLLAFSGTAIACFLPPLFLVGARRSYGFFERLVRMLEVQAFFFFFLVLAVSAFLYYTVRQEDNMVAIMNAHYFSAATRLLMCLYLYLSIEVCLRSQDMPLPYGCMEPENNDMGDFDKSESEQEKDEEWKSEDLGEDFLFHIKTPLSVESVTFAESAELAELAESLNSQKSVGEQGDICENHKEIWRKYQKEMPNSLKSTISFAQVIGFLLLSLGLFPVFNVGLPTFVINYSFIPAFFLYFYLLYMIGKRPYALWRLAYLCLNLYIFMAYVWDESLFWQILLLGFFLFQCFVFYVFYCKNKEYFLE